MILEIVMFGHPALRTKGAKVAKIDPAIHQLAEDMLETMRDADGVGLAAQQVGVALQLTVIDVSGIEDRPSAIFIDGKEAPLEEHMPMVIINPELTLGPDRESGVEGCLSFPEMTGQILRSSRVGLKAQRLDGSVMEFEATGLLARAIQHEIDHLNGVLFIDRMNSATKASLAGKLKRLQKSALG